MRRVSRKGWGKEERGEEEGMKEDEGERGKDEGERG